MLSSDEMDVHEIGKDYHQESHKAAEDYETYRESEGGQDEKGVAQVHLGMEARVVLLSWILYLTGQAVTFQTKRLLAGMGTGTCYGIVATPLVLAAYMILKAIVVGPPTHPPDANFVEHGGGGLISFLLVVVVSSFISGPVGAAAGVLVAAFVCVLEKAARRRRTIVGLSIGLGAVIGAAASHWFSSGRSPAANPTPIDLLCSGVLIGALGGWLIAWRQTRRQQ